MEKITNSVIRNAGLECPLRLYSTMIYTAKGPGVFSLYLQCLFPQGHTRSSVWHQIQLGLLATIQYKQDSSKNTLTSLMLTRTPVYHSVLSSISVLPRRATETPSEDAVRHEQTASLRQGLRLVTALSHCMQKP